MISAYCNMDSLNGGWTLLTNFASRDGWKSENIEMRGASDPMTQDYSIFKYADDIKNSDQAEVICKSS